MAASGANESDSENETNDSSMQADSMTELQINSWEKLKQALIDEFSFEINSALLHELLRNRKIRDCETTSEYFLKMKELCNSRKIDDSALMHYVIKDSGSRVTLIGKSVYDKINHVQLFPLNTALRGFSNSKVRLFGCFKDDIQIDDLKCNVEICVVDDDAMLYDVIIGLNVLMQVPVKKDGLRVKDDQRTVTVSPVVKVPVELQHPSVLLKLEDDLKRLEKPNPMIQCVTEEPDEYIVDETEELHLENCLKDVKEDKACIPLKKTDPVVVVPESVPKEVKRQVHEKRRPRLEENKDYYFIPKRRQKIENSAAYCDHRVLVNHKRRKKEDVPLKTCHIDHLRPHRITEIEEGVMEQTVRFEQDFQ
ncbi:retrovirus-related Pol polyprotein from transposon 297 [Trichonephila clavipes]|nr:retrovirus-related Pol polyprotein from transposon 297 [Trichonephila clavipes]